MSKVYLFIVDDGHGVETAGKRTPKFSDGTVMKENEFNDAVCDFLEVEAKRHPNVILFRTAPEDKDVALSVRSSRANAKYKEVCAKYSKENVVCIFLSVHANAFKGEWGDWGGISSHYYNDSVKGKKLATIMQKHLTQGTPLRDRGVLDNNFHVLRETVMPAVLVECAFMDNLHEATLVKSTNYRKECAVELMMGACEYFGIPYVPYVEPKKTEKNKTGGKGWRVSIGYYEDINNAKAAVEKAEKLGLDAYLVSYEKK
jgi:N-acetylmuramoyl-L-alanine amidase